MPHFNKKQLHMGDSMNHDMTSSLSNLVPHPRYGNAVRKSICVVSEKVVRESFWRYRGECIFPESAIAADTSLQVYTVLSRPWYVDILKKCATCGRPFLFFAEEQRYWYEFLKFTVDADCIRCSECRVSERELRERFNRFSLMTSRLQLNDEEVAQYLDDAMFLFRQGVIKDIQKLGRAKNMGLRQIPTHAATQNIIELLESIQH